MQLETRKCLWGGGHHRGSFLLRCVILAAEGAGDLGYLNSSITISGSQWVSQTGGGWEAGGLIY